MSGSSSLPLKLVPDRADERELIPTVKARPDRADGRELYPYRLSLAFPTVSS
jgi:hypothetical protein